MKPLVSISCITYNHEDYIVDAIEGFLMQKTNFDFEILIHDDASTDRTAQIIRDYQKRYPEIIKPILQTENQHSKGVKRISYIYNHNRSKGKYIALCEGDDYWTDENKLQKQVDYMEQNPDCSMCFHAVNIKDEKRNKIVEYPRLYNENTVLDNSKIFPHNSKKTATCSFLYRKEVLNSPPGFFFDSLVGDYPTAFILAFKGRTFYYNEVMAIYRRSIKGSYTERHKEFSSIIKSETNKKEFLILYNEYTNYKFNQQIAEIINHINIKLLIHNNCKKSKLLFLRNSNISLKNFTKIQIITFYLKMFFPRIYKLLFNIKNRY